MPIVKVNSESRMKKIQFTVHTLALLLAMLLSAVAVSAQSASSQGRPPSDGPSRTKDDDTPLTTFEEELRAKRAIKMAEKEHQENLDRAREIQKLAKELNESLKGKTVIEREDLKKIERLEKLTKKVRGEAGGDDEDVTIANPPKDLPAAACQIAEKAESLSKEVQNTPRQVVSASVIGSANVLLELIKLARTFGRLQSTQQ